MANPMRLTGTFTAIVTPFTPDGESVDAGALDTLVEDQIQGGVSGLVPCGTTGESPTLTDEEQAFVIKRVVAKAKGRVPVLAGTGSFSTKKTKLASKAAMEAGADGVMIVMPYYNKPSQDGMREHVISVAKAVGEDCPIVLYNIPGRTAVEIAPETLAKLESARAELTRAELDKISATRPILVWHRSCPNASSRRRRRAPSSPRPRSCCSDRCGSTPSTPPICPGSPAGCSPRPGS